MIKLLGVGVEGCDGRDICLLTRGGGTVGGSCLMNFVQAALDHLGIGVVPELVPYTHGHAPVRHGAARVVDGDPHEFLFGFLVPKRVQQSDAALERLLDIWCAGDGEADGSELRSGQVLMMMVLIIVCNGRRGEWEKQGEEKQ